MESFLDTPNIEKLNKCGMANGLRYAVSCMQGKRLYMEDTHCAIAQLPGNLKNWSFFAIFDGHAGSLVSELCTTELVKCIVATEAFKMLEAEQTPNLEKIKQGIREGFLELDERLRKLPQIISGEDKSGCAAVCVLISPSHIFFANCGDSRAVLIRNGSIAFATTDHKPTQPTERERIQKAGGSVIDDRVNGSLSLSRSIGDYTYKAAESLSPTEQLVSPEPEVTVIDRVKEADEMIVLACDGVWDVMNDFLLCLFVKDRIQRVSDLTKFCDEMVDYCLYTDSWDNISAVVVAFESAPIANPKFKLEDELIEKEIERLTNEYLDKQTSYTSLYANAILQNIIWNSNIPSTKIGLYHKCGIVQRLLNARQAQSSCSEETNNNNTTT